jgi:hypothetical protein
MASSSLSYDATIESVWSFVGNTEFSRPQVAAAVEAANGDGITWHHSHYLPSLLVVIITIILMV